jgi:hypothetical protein
MIEHLQYILGDISNFKHFASRLFGPRHVADIPMVPFHPEAHPPLSAPNRFIQTPQRCLEAALKRQGLAGMATHRPPSVDPYGSHSPLVVI